jgi:hypothetical protein
MMLSSTHFHQLLKVFQHNAVIPPHSSFDAGAGSMEKVITPSSVRLYALIAGTAVSRRCTDD